MTFVKSYGRLPPEAISEEIRAEKIYHKKIMYRNQTSEKQLRKDRLISRLSQTRCLYERKFLKLCGETEREIRLHREENQLKA